jgi:hypothetical protein
MFLEWAKWTAAGADSRRRQQARLREHRELQEALTESNVIPFRRKH